MAKPQKEMTVYRKRATAYTLFALPQTLIYIVFFIAPILLGIFYSFTDYNGIKKEIQFVGFSNYKSMFTTGHFGRAMIFNLKYCLLTVTLSIVIGLALALLLTSKIKGRGIFRSLYFLPAVLPGLTMGLIFNIIFGKGLPQLGAALGIEALSKSLLSSPTTALYALVAVSLWGGVAIPTVLFMAGLQTIPQELIESTELDGATPWQRFRYLKMPFLRPTLSMVFVLKLKGGLMVFDTIMALTGGGPAGTTESMASLIYQHGFVERKMSQGMAEALVLALIVCTISIVQIAWSNRKQVY